MYGLGKDRSRLGKFLDTIKKNQRWLTELSGVSRNEVSRLCDGKNTIQPQAQTVQRIISSLRKHGYDVQASDFW